MTDDAESADNLPPGDLAIPGLDSDDDWVPTEVEVQRDQVRAVKFLVAIVIGITSAAGPVGAAIAGFAGTYVPEILGKLLGRRVRNASEAALDAASAAGLGPEEFLRKAVSDDHRQELLARALTIAQDTALRNKRRALGRALAAGVMGDDAKIDEELLFMRAVDDIYEMDIRLLGRFADGSRWTAEQIARGDPGLADGLQPLLGNLQSRGLIDSRSPVTPGGAMTPEPVYFITTSGRDFLDRLSGDTA